MVEPMRGSSGAGAGRGRVVHRVDEVEVLAVGRCARCVHALPFVVYSIDLIPNDGRGDDESSRCAPARPEKKILTVLVVGM